MQDRTKWVRLVIADSPDLFALPEVGVFMQVDITWADGAWHVRSGEGEASWVASGETQDGAILNLIAVRLGLNNYD